MGDVQELSIPLSYVHEIFGVQSGLGQALLRVNADVLERLAKALDSVTDECVNPLSVKLDPSSIELSSPLAKPVGDGSPRKGTMPQPNEVAAAWLDIEPSGEVHFRCGTWYSDFGFYRSENAVPELADFVAEHKREHAASPRA